MIYETLHHFFIYNGYIFELLVSLILFCHFFEPKRHFALRFLFWFALFFLFYYVWGITETIYSLDVWGSSLRNIFKYLIMFLLGFSGVYFCMRITWSGALFCIICAMTTQHLAFRVYSSILAITDTGYTTLSAFFITLSVTAAVNLAMYFIFVRRIKNRPEQCLENKVNILLGGLLILFTIILHFWAEALIAMLETPALSVLISIYNIICCVCTLALEYGLFRTKILTGEKELLEHLIRNQENQYQMAKANIEMINIKCHDMKHQILRLTNQAAPETVQEMEEIINIYDSTLKTGNEILDIFLMEKKLLCEKNHIKLDCIVNGACLSFMQASDIYSLFGNALDNAIEALCKIEDTERRIIGLSVKTQMSMVIIHVENYCDQELQFDNEIPLTTKQDVNYHGFGIKSIQMVADKYSGNMSILIQDGIFNLNVIIPQP